MTIWTEAEFQRVAVNTRIADRTLVACRDVLVEGMSVTEAAAKHKTFISQISRANITLREKQQQMTEVAPAVPALDDKTATSRSAAMQAAKDICGQAFSVRDAVPGHTYEGQIVAKTQDFVIQKVGRSGVLYELNKFKSEPPLNADVIIKVSERQGRLTMFVSDRNPGRQQDKGVGR
ncbi:MAG: hypothetical protein V4713_12360 [Pseudomonadota bacterium]